MMDTNKQFPWLDKNGEPLSDEKLKEVVKTWNPTTWEKYLKTIEVTRKESQIVNQDFFDTRAERIQISTLFQEIEAGPKYDCLKTALHGSIKALLPKQKTVIVGLYFGNISIRQLAKELKVSHTAVSKIRDRALENLKVTLEKNYLSIKRENGNPLSTVSTQVSTIPLYEGIKKLITKLGLDKSEEL